LTQILLLRTLRGMPPQLNPLKGDIPLRRMWFTTMAAVALLLIACAIVLFFFYRTVPPPTH
jgi:hypothetical protein